MGVGLVGLWVQEEHINFSMKGRGRQAPCKAANQGVRIPALLC